MTKLKISLAVLSFAALATAPASVARVFAAAQTHAPAAPAQELSKEAKDLQGIWDVTLFNDQATPEGSIALQFDGTKYAVLIDGGADETGTFKLDATKTPWTFDLDIKTGNDAGKMQLGILEMKSGAIHGSLGTPGESARPANFDAQSAVVFVAVKRK